MDSKALTAARKGNVTRLKELLAKGVSINAQDNNGLTLLHHAVSNGQSEVIRCLLESGADVLLATNNTKETVLHIAVTESDETLVKSILAKVARDKLRKLLDAKTKLGTAAIHVAAERSSLKLVSMLLENGANYEIRNSAGKKPIDLTTNKELRGLLQLIDASFAKAKRGDYDLAKDLEPSLKNLSPILNCRNDEGRTITQLFVLHYVVSKSSLDEAMTFEDVHAMMYLRVNQAFKTDRLALREQSRKGDLEELAERLRECDELWCKPMREDVACKLDRAREVLSLYRKLGGSLTTAEAATRCVEDMFEIFEGIDLIEQSERYQVKLPSEWEDEVTFLHAFYNHVKGVIHKSILELEGALVWTQMMHAVKDDDLDKAQKVIGKSGAALKVADAQLSRTIMCFAVEGGNRKMVKLLLKSGVNAPCVKCGAPRPLYLAVSKGHAKIVKMLLDKTEDLVKTIDCRYDEFGLTVLHAAALAGRLDLVTMLLRFGASYEVRDDDGRTPLEVSTSEEVTELLALVESCFDNAKEANTELVFKLKNLSSDLFLAVAGAKNEQGQTLAVVADKADAKTTVGMISRMMREVKGNEQ